MDDLLARVVIASPCPASWEAMAGDDRVRSCELCEKRVYNLSALSAAEANALLSHTEGRICARLYRRKDGTILTADCPEGRRRLLGRRLRRLVTGGILTAALAHVGAALASRMAASGDRPASISTPALALNRLVNTVKGMFGFAPCRATMGVVRLAPSTSTGTPVMGEISVTPAPPAGDDATEGTGPEA